MNGKRITAYRVRFEVPRQIGDAILVARDSGSRDESEIVDAAPMTFAALAALLRYNKNGQVLLSETTIDGGPETMGRKKQEQRRRR